MGKGDSIETRIKEKTKILPNGCWEWVGAKLKKDSGSYGQIRIGTRENNKLKRAHVVSYILYKGKIPKGKEIDHICRNTLCVNPDHLQAITHKENCKRRKDSGLPYCKHGHKYTIETTYINTRGIRECKICKRLHR